MTIYCQTVCINCRHHEGKGTWYNHICKHEEGVRQQEQNPVTGEIEFSMKNDLGRSVFVEEEYPYCRDVNHGNCPLYEEK